MSATVPAIEARGLTRRFGPVVALEPLDLSVPSGSTLAVLGPNGAGKSTLLRLLAGLASPSGGTLRLAATDEDRVSRRRRIGMIGHETFLYPALSARENLILAGRLWGVTDPAARAGLLLDEQDLGPAADRQVGSFSRGMCQRVAIARALVHDPEILLLDEPFTGLDPTAADRLAERLGEARSTGRTTVMVTHDLARAAQLADDVLILVRGSAHPGAPESRSDAAQLAREYRQVVDATSRPRVEASA